VRSARRLAAALAFFATAAAGCGLGPGKETGEVELTVTRDYGTKLMERKTESIRESDTVLRVLDRSAEITTRYGGGFVQSIDGLEGGQSGGRSSDWFFYVNGIESPVGAAQYDLDQGDRVWWDYRDWTAAMRVPAVVGSWPEPFVHGFRGQTHPTAVDCRAPAAVCATVSDRLRGAGIQVSSSGADSIMVEVGEWGAIRDDRSAGPLAGPPSGSGVFAHFVGTRKPLLDLLDERGDLAGSIGKGGGLVAALRQGDGPPTWVVTGTDGRGVAAAANLLGPALRDHYAVATQPGTGAIGVPVP
jgi:hypothetical protein